MKEEEKLLYQDLSSIKPRVSREERLASRRNTPCSDCSPSFNRAKKSAKNLYFFYIAILALGFVATQIHQRRVNQLPSIETKNKQISVSFSQKISITLIDQPSRYGLSILFRNNSRDTWNVDNIELTLDDLSNHNIKINQQIPPKDFYSLFIPLSQKINNIDKVNITI